MEFLYWIVSRCQGGLPLVHPSWGHLIHDRIRGPGNVGPCWFGCTTIPGKVSLFATVVAGASGLVLLLAILACIDSLAPLLWHPALTQIHGDWSVIVTWWSSTQVEPWLVEVLLLALWLWIPLLLWPVHAWLCCRFCINERVDQDS